MRLARRPADIVFTSGATEAAALAFSKWHGVLGTLDAAKIEHDSVNAWVSSGLQVQKTGIVRLSEDAGAQHDPIVLQLANSETGVMQTLTDAVVVSDLTQAFGKVPFAFDWLGCEAGLISAHKLGGPKGIGAYVVRRGEDVPAMIPGGGQEMGRRSGTENVIGIAGIRCGC